MGNRNWEKGRERTCVCVCERDRRKMCVWYCHILNNNFLPRKQSTFKYSEVVCVVVDTLKPTLLSGQIPVGPPTVLADTDPGPVARFTPGPKVLQLEGEKVDWEVTFTSMFQGMRRRPSRSTDSVCGEREREREGERVCMYQREKERAYVGVKGSGGRGREE